VKSVDTEAPQISEREAKIKLLIFKQYLLLILVKNCKDKSLDFIIAQRVE
jgi:hypothetical protein